jgi:AcrR family transcriptional regulator
MVKDHWLGERRAEVAADRILDAAGELFAQQQVSRIGMNEIAAAAGCSRATLYRYFDSRDALYLAYVHRETQRFYLQIAKALGEITDSRERLLVGLTMAMAMVRESPASSAWFSASGPPLGGELAEQSDVIRTLVGGFLSALRPGDPADVIDRRARWLIRVLTSLLIFPGRDADDERAMLEDFVVPVVCPADAPNFDTPSSLANGDRLGPMRRTDT